jgi:hypothetical protein
VLLERPVGPFVDHYHPFLHSVWNYLKVWQYNRLEECDLTGYMAVLVILKMKSEKLILNTQKAFVLFYAINISEIN